MRDCRLFRREQRRGIGGIGQHVARGEIDDAAEAEKLCETFTDYRIPDEIIDRLKKAGDKDAQRKEGLKICLELIQEIKKLTGLRGIHILSGGKEAILPELLSSSGLGK